MALPAINIAVTGDVARVNHPDDAAAYVLKKTGDRWQVTEALGEQKFKAMGPVFTAAADAMRAVTAEVLEGKYRTDAEVAAAISARQQASQPAKQR